MGAEPPRRAKRVSCWGKILYRIKFQAYGLDGGRHLPNKEGSFFTTGLATLLSPDEKVEFQ